MIETILDISRESNCIVFHLQVVNNDHQALHLTFSSGKKYEIVVKDAEEAVIYNSSKGKFYTQAFENLLIKPYRRVSWKETWKNAHLPPGIYSVHAIITPYEVKPTNKQQLQAFRVFEVE